jgi:hypothetical protein
MSSPIGDTLWSNTRKTRSIEDKLKEGTAKMKREQNGWEKMMMKERDEWKAAMKHLEEKMEEMMEEMMEEKMEEKMEKTDRERDRM